VRTRRAGCARYSSQRIETRRCKINKTLWWEGAPLPEKRLPPLDGCVVTLILYRDHDLRSQNSAHNANSAPFVPGSAACLSVLTAIARL